jgi:hypothetical protein
VITDVLQRLGLRVRTSRSDFLAYPFTGCYAGSAFGRNERFMRFLMAMEDWVENVPGLSWIGQLLAWRFTIIATKASPGPAETAS